MADEPNPGGMSRELRAPGHLERAWASERLGALASDLAHPAAVFYRGLTDNGLTPEEAADLTDRFIAKLLGDIKAP